MFPRKAEQMPIQYDRVKRCYYDDVTNEDIPRDQVPKPTYWHNPDGTSNDIP